MTVYEIAEKILSSTGWVALDCHLRRSCFFKSTEGVFQVVMQVTPQLTSIEICRGWNEACNAILTHSTGEWVLCHGELSEFSDVTFLEEDEL